MKKRYADIGGRKFLFLDNGRGIAIPVSDIEDIDFDPSSSLDGVKTARLVINYGDNKFVARGEDAVSLWTFLKVPT